MGKRFLHNRAAVVTVAFVLLIALIGILAPLLAPHDPYVTDILDKFAPYSLEYPLGTDHLGRCVLSRLIYGIRPTLGLALLTMLGTSRWARCWALWPATSGAWWKKSSCGWWT